MNTLTPDLLPSDITGSPVYNPNTGEFKFKEGWAQLAMYF